MARLRVLPGQAAVGVNGFLTVFGLRHTIGHAVVKSCDGVEGIRSDLRGWVVVDDTEVE